MPGTVAVQYRTQAQSMQYGSVLQVHGTLIVRKHRSRPGHYLNSLLGAGGGGGGGEGR